MGPLAKKVADPWVKWLIHYHCVCWCTLCGQEQWRF